MKKGEQKRIPTPGQQVNHHLFAAYNWADDTVSWTLAERKNSEAFIHFLDHLLVNAYPTQPIVLVLDNAPYHTSYASQAAISLFEHRVWFFWLPKYSSLELNPIERFWRFLKDQVCVNKLFPDMTQLVEAVERLLSAQNDQSNSDRYLFSKFIQ